MRLVYIEWQDAHTKSGWHDKEETKEFCKNHEFMIKECGWVVEETKKHIVFCSALKEETDYWEEQKLNLHKIPKSWIRKKQVILIK